MKLLTIILSIFTANLAFGFESHGPVALEKPRGEFLEFLFSNVAEVGIHSLSYETRFAKATITNCSHPTTGRLIRTPHVEIYGDQMFAFNLVEYRSPGEFQSGVFCYFEPMEVISVTAPTDSLSRGIINLGFTKQKPYMAYDQFPDLNQLPSLYRANLGEKWAKMLISTFRASYLDKISHSQKTPDTVKAYTVYEFAIHGESEFLSQLPIENSTAKYENTQNWVLVRSELCYTRTEMSKETNRYEWTIIKKNEELRSDWLIGLRRILGLRNKVSDDIFMKEINQYFAKNQLKSERCRSGYYDTVAETYEAESKKYNEIWQAGQGILSQIKAKQLELKQYKQGPNGNNNDKIPGVVKAIQHLNIDMNESIARLKDQRKVLDDILN